MEFTAGWLAFLAVRSHLRPSTVANIQSRDENQTQSMVHENLAKVRQR